MRFKLILATVKTEISDKVVAASKEAGVPGATIITARGTGIHEAKTFFGLSLEAQTDIILFLVEEHMVHEIMKVISEAGEFHKPGTGIAFSIPVDHVLGMESQIDKFKKEVQDNYF